jgi:antitoxin component of RelBE/YafQ-DinJ toxin-antitoxin module
MNKPYILNLTDEEKADLQKIADELGMSLSELVNIALADALAADITGVYINE